MRNSREKTHTIIIGAGQAGLSVARYLKEYNIPFIILEKETSIGSSWNNRYDSLVLDSFAKYSALDKFPFPGNQNRHPKKDEVVTYLWSFATQFDLHPQFNTCVESITKEDSLFIVKTNQAIYEAQTVVLATGPFQVPYLPSEAKNLPHSIHQLHAMDYKNPSFIPSGTILIVGGGNSGTEIAKELTEHNRTILFSFKGKLRSVKSTQLSQWIAYRLGIAHIPRKSLLGRLVEWYTKGKSIGMDVGKLAKSSRVSFVGKLISITQNTIVTTKGKLKNLPNVIIWATGYKNDFSVIHIPEFSPKSSQRGVTNIEGLYLLNIRWHHSKSSSHLAGISRDAKFIAKQIARHKNKKY